LCGEVFTAKAPSEVGEDKYDVGVTSTIAILKFGYGIPYDRLERLQKSVGIPMPASTQYELLEDGAIPVKPVHQEMLRQGARDVSASVLCFGAGRRHDRLSLDEEANHVGAAVRGGGGEIEE
jgi:hypothetical protein